MPPKCKNASPLTTKPPTTASNTIFFYHLNVKPYDVFCQWKPSPITISKHVLLTICDNPSTPSILVALKAGSSETMSQLDSEFASGDVVTFTCAEQAYMFFKALCFSDASSCTAILAAKDPGSQKLLGQEVKGFSDTQWDEVKSRVARTVDWYKFTHPTNTHMRASLLETGEREIAEASSRDRVWGIGYKEEVTEKYRKSWRKNILGRAIMAVRARIRGRELRDEENGVRGEWEWEWDGAEGGKSIGDVEIG